MHAGSTHYAGPCSAPENRSARDASLSEGAYEAPARSSMAATGDEDVIQAAEEQLRVGKREVGRGSVRVRSYVTERPVEEQVNLREETVHVERRAVDRPVEAGDMAFQEKEIEAVERGEEAVVSKEARVTEEITLARTSIPAPRPWATPCASRRSRSTRTGVEVEPSGTINPARTDW